MSWVTAGAHHLFLQTFKKKCRSHYITMTTFKSFQRRKLFHCCALMKIILCLNTSFSYALKSVGGKIKKSVPQTVTISYDTILISVCILWLAFRSKSYSLCIICSVMCIFCCKRYFLPPGTMKLNSEWLTLILCKSQCVIFNQFLVDCATCARESAYQIDVEIKKIKKTVGVSASLFSVITKWGMDFAGDKP